MATLEIDREEYSTDLQAKNAYRNTQGNGGLGSGLIAHFKLNENTDNTEILENMSSVVATSSRNTNEASVVGKINRAINFRGSTYFDHIITPLFNHNIGTGDFTFCAWVKPTSLTGSPTGSSIFAFGDYSPLFYITYDGYLRYYWAGGFDFGGVVNLSEWSFIQVKRKDGVISAKINNVDCPYTSSEVREIVNDQITIGVDGKNLYGDLFDGDIDDVRLYNRFTTTEEDALLYNSGNGTEDDSIIADTINVYSEPTIKTQGNYSLKVIADQITSLNKKIRKTLSSDLSEVNNLKFDLRSNRIGQNIKFSLMKQGDSSHTAPGKALDFNGTYGNWCRGSVANLPLGNSNRTIYAWFKASTVSQDHSTIFSYGQAISGNVITLLDIRADGTLYTETGSGANAIHSLGSVLDGGWHMGALTFDGTYLKMYLDGILQGTSEPTYLDTLTSDFDVGDMVWATGYPFNGSIDEVVIFDRELSESEIISLYNNGDGVYGDIANSPFNANLVAGWHFDEGSGLLLSDFSENSNTLTAVNQVFVDGIIKHIVIELVSVSDISPIIRIVDNFITVNWDIADVTNNDKKEILALDIEIVNADEENIFYLDNIEIAQAIDVMGLIDD